MNVRRYREDTAKRAVAAAEHAVSAAQDDVVAKTKDLETYRLWRSQEVTRRYASIIGKMLSHTDLDIFKDGLTALALAEQDKESAVCEAKNCLEQRRNELEDCRKIMAQARKDSAKLEIHRDFWQTAQNHEAERREDSELEEFRPPASMETPS